MDRAVDCLLAIGAIIIGIMLLTGRGDFFMKGGNAEARSKEYDEEKMKKVSGIACILAGIATGLNFIFHSMTMYVIYIILIFVIFLGLFLYIKFKCRK